MLFKSEQNGNFELVLPLWMNWTRFTQTDGADTQPVLCQKTPAVDSATKQWFEELCFVLYACMYKYYDLKLKTHFTFVKTTTEWLFCFQLRRYRSLESNWVGHRRGRIEEVDVNVMIQCLTWLWLVAPSARVVKCWSRSGSMVEECRWRMSNEKSCLCWPPLAEGSDGSGPRMRP